MKAILKSPAVWGLWAGHFAGDWGAYIMAAGLPLYMNDVLGFDLTSVSYISLSLEVADWAVSISL